MNQKLYSKIKQTIIEKNCLYQVDENMRASIVHNISAYVTEMMEQNNNNIQSNLYDFNEFREKSSDDLYQYFLKKRLQNNYDILPYDHYYNIFKEGWSNLLTKELNEN